MQLIFICRYYINYHIYFLVLNTTPGNNDVTSVKDASVLGNAQYSTFFSGCDSENNSDNFHICGYGETSNYKLYYDQARG